jgi:hypothetical protein
MKGLSCVLVASVVFASCGGTQPDETADAGAFNARPYGSLNQVMQAIPFPASNIIFDASNEDPEEVKKRMAEDKGGSSGARASYGSVYAGWQEVENAAMALRETANLIMIPGRMCENGRPVPVDQEDFRRFAEGLAQAGEEAYKAALSKDLDEMLIVGGTVTEACAACHEVYRDKDDQAERCIPPATAAN